MLNNYNYIVIDFETTGVDIKKDEPIQFGLIKFDSNFNVINTYQSLIKPKKNISELKNIVSFITGFKLCDLQTAPGIHQVVEEITGFFDKNTVIIGHSVNFDIGFLKKYLDFDYLFSIDTVNLAKEFFHFSESYALEVLSEKLKNQNRFNITLDSYYENSYHDALYDCLSTLNLFKYYIDELTEIFKSFPILGRLINNSDGFFSKLVTVKDYAISSSTKLFLPPLKQEIKGTNHYVTNPISVNLSDYSSNSTLYIGNYNIKEILNEMLGKEKYILAFSSRAKLNIAKNVLQQLGVKKLSYINNDYNFENDKVVQFMSKDNYEDFEISFCIKYFSHFLKGYSIIDLNSQQDYYIYNFLTTNNTKSKGNIILTQHYSLFKAIKDNDLLLNNYKIIFFDKDWWYFSLSKFVNTYFDFYVFIAKTEELIYYYSYKKGVIYNQLLKLREFLLMFIGVLFIELNEKFKGVGTEKIEINPLIGNIDFYRINDLYDKFVNFSEYFLSIKDDKLIDLKSFFEDVIYLFNNICLVEKKMYDQDKYYFIFHRNSNVINYSEFSNYFDGKDVLFFTNTDKMRSVSLNPSKPVTSYPTTIQKINLLNEFVNNIDDYNSIFILSNLKKSSNDLFELLYSKGVHNKFSIQVENITGGQGKCIFYAKKFEKKIIIGGFEFLLSTLYENIKYDNIFTLNLGGPFEKNIIKDIYFYGLYK